MTLIHCTPPSETIHPSCPRCLRPTLYPGRLIFNLDEAVEQLGASGSTKIRTESSLYSNISRGTAPKVLSTPGASIRIRHCDIEDFVSELTDDERAHIGAYDALADASRTLQVRQATQSLLGQMMELVGSAEDIERAAEDLDLDERGDISSLRRLVLRLKKQLASTQKRVEQAVQLASDVIKVKKVEEGHLTMSPAEREAAAARAWAIEARR